MAIKRIQLPAAAFQDDGPPVDTAALAAKYIGGLPDASGTFEGHLVGACDPPCEVCLAAYHDWLAQGL
jgi:hypothetical protein